MVTLNDVLTLSRFIASTFTGSGLRDEIVSRYGLIYALLLLTQNGHAPPIISGRRTLDEQHELFHKWERGEIKNRPAKNSWHTEGLAIDVFEGAGNFKLFTDLWILFGGRWGGRFGLPDIGHFDYPLPGITPKPAF